MQSGIYSITSPSGGQYIGSAVNFSRRWSVHLHRLRKNDHHSKPLQNAFNKYGEAAMVFAKVLLCERADLLMYEQKVIDAFGPKYNVCQLAGNTLGVVHTAASRAKMSAFHSGKTLTQEHRDRIGAASKGNFHTAEARSKISAALKGRRHSAEHRAKNSAFRKGVTKGPHAPETSAKISAARSTTGLRGVDFAKDRNAWRGRVTVNGRRINLGYFETPEKAHAAVMSALAQPNTG